MNESNLSSTNESIRYINKKVELKWKGLWISFKMKNHF
jgi:hypothetical protein